MKRADFDHVIAAAAAVVEDDLVVIGSQSVLGPHPDAPDALLASLEETATPPAGWEDRLIPVKIETLLGLRRTITAWCLEPHDLVLAKLVAGRPHDRTFALGALRAGIVEPDRLRRGVPLLPSSVRRVVEERLEGVVAEALRG